MNTVQLKNVFLYSILLFISMVDHLHAQINFSPYPIIKHSNFLTPTHSLNRLEKDEKTSANVLHQRYLNLFTDVYLVNFSGFVKIKSKNQLGMLASSSKEGPYISKSNAGLHFASGINISKNAFLSVGVMAGINSIKFDDNNTGANNGTSSSAPDLAIDLLVQHKNYYFSYKYNQLLSVLLKPLNTPLTMKKFQEVRIGVKIKVGRKTELSPQGHILLYENRSIPFGGSLILTTNSLLSIGIASYNLTTAVYQLALHVPVIKKWKTSITGSYSQLVSRKQHNLYYNTLEIGLVITKKDKKEDEVVNDGEE